MEQTVFPGYSTIDLSTNLNKLKFAEKDFELRLYSETRLRINSKVLNPAIGSGRLGTSAFYSWSFTQAVIAGGNSIHYNDFDIVWSSGLDKAFMTAYNKLSDMFKMVPKGDTLKAEFFGRTTSGIDARYKISLDKSPDYHPFYTFISKDILFDTEFAKSEIIFRPEDDPELSEAIVSMLLLMIMEPNVFVNIKVATGSETLTPGANFLNLDIYGFYDNDVLQEGRIADSHRIDGSSVWLETGAGDIFTREAFDSFRYDFKGILRYQDIMHFTGFDNHKGDSRYATMFDYVKAKIFGHFFTLGTFTDKSKLFDLRKDIGWYP